MSQSIECSFCSHISCYGEQNQRALIFAAPLCSRIVIAGADRNPRWTIFFSLPLSEGQVCRRYHPHFHGAQRTPVLDSPQEISRQGKVGVPSSRPWQEPNPTPWSYRTIPMFRSRYFAVERAVNRKIPKYTGLTSTTQG